MTDFRAGRLITVCCCSTARRYRPNNRFTHTTGASRPLFRQKNLPPGRQSTFGRLSNRPQLTSRERLRISHIRPTFYTNRTVGRSLSRTTRRSCLGALRRLRPTSTRGQALDGRSPPRSRQRTTRYAPRTRCNHSFGKPLLYRHRLTHGLLCTGSRPLRLRLNSTG